MCLQALCPSNTNSNSFTEKANNNLIDLIRKIYEQGGYEAFFRGLQASLSLILNPIIQFVLYEFLRSKFRGIVIISLHIIRQQSYFTSLIEIKDQTLYIVLFAAISKATATIFTYP